MRKTNFICIFSSLKVLIGVILMAWVVHKARHELSVALLSEFEDGHKIIVDI